MCRGISAIAVQRGDRRLYYKSGVNSHSGIRETLGITDYKVGEQVNLESWLYGDFYNIKDWKVVVDHDLNNLPAWFVEDRPMIEDLFIQFVEDEIKATKADGCYKGNLDLDYLKSSDLKKKKVVLPQSIGGNLSLYSLTTAEGLVLPQSIWLLS